MTLIASLLFLSALATAVLAILATISNAMPRILQIIESELVPEVPVERRIAFGQVRHRKARICADVVAFPQKARAEQGYRLAA